MLTHAMRFWRSVGCGLLLLLACAASVQAQLKWESPTVELHPSLTDRQVSGEYRFVNEGKTAVTIRSIQTGCGCTTVALEKKTYQPGESGVLPVVFDIGKLQGVQQKNILVTQDSGVSALSLKVMLPTFYELSPSLLIWDVHGLEQSKTVKVLAKSESDVRVTGAKWATALPKSKGEPGASGGSGDDWSIQVQEVVPGREYELKLTPSRQTLAGLGSLAIQVEPSGDDPSKRTISERLPSLTVSVLVRSSDKPSK